MMYNRRRAWVYLDGSKLPEWFTDGNGCDYRKVPQRFHREVAGT